MYLIDYHVHTYRCGHACGADREYVETAINQGLREIGFADHVPRFYQAPEASVKVTERGMSWAELEAYIQAVHKLREQYPEIQIKLGLEMDYVPGWEREIERISREYPWDYLIGSVHFIPEWSYGYIGNEKERDPAAVYPKYFDLVAQAAESGLYDILGHIDLPKRTFQKLASAEMTQLYHRLAERLGKAKAVIEVNSYGLRCSKERVVGIYPDLELLEMTRKNGVRVTLGSDAHRPKDVGADFKAASELLSRAGYEQLVVYTQRQASLISWQA